MLLDTSTSNIPKIILYLFRYYRSMKWEIQYTDILAFRQQQCLISANVTLFVKLCVSFVLSVQLKIQRILLMMFVEDQLAVCGFLPKILFTANIIQHRIMTNSCISSRLPVLTEDKISFLFTQLTSLITIVNTKRH